MAPPVTVVVEVYYDSAYHVITSDVETRDAAITITRGKAEGAGDASPSTLSLSLNNGTSKVNASITGRYSPRNPNSDLYGKIGRNTLIRITVDTSVRFVGEVSEFPPKWDNTGRDAWVPLQAAGITRRLGQGQSPIQSSAKAYVVSQAPYAYWPLDDAPGTLNGVNLGVGKGQGFTPNRGAGSTVVANFGAGDLGDLLPKGLALSDSALASLTAYSYPAFSVGHTSVALDFVFKSSDVLGTLSMQVNDLVESAWQINFRPDGSNNDIQCYEITNLGNPAGPTTTSLGDTAALVAMTDTALHHVRWQQVQSGADTVWTLFVDKVSVLTGTAVGVHMNGANLLRVVYQISGTITPIALEHVVLWVDTIPSITDCYAATVTGFSGEAAGTRISRICTAAGISFTSVGTLSDTVLMGPQPSADVLSVLRDAAGTDMGALVEARAAASILYIPRTYSYNRAADLTLDYSLGQLIGPFEPVDDDLLTRNDITVSNTSGSNYEAVKTTGPLNTSAPSLQNGGVGPYTDSVSVNIASDNDLRDQAGWRLRLGTFDGYRFPTIRIHRQRKAITSNPTLDTAILAFDLGQRMVISNATAKNIFDNISLIALGEQESITQFEHVLDFNLTMEGPYQVGVYDAVNSAEGGNRYSTDGSTVQAATTSGATSLPVSTLSGPPWAFNDGTYDLRVAGERMSVTAVDAILPAFVAASTSVTGNNASLSPTLPAGTASGDTVFIYATIRNTAASITTPTNWTAVGGTGHIQLFARVYDGVWTMPSVVFTGGSAGDDTLAQAATFRYVDIVNRSGFAVVANGSQQNVDYGVLTPTYDNALTIKMFWKQDDWTSVATPTAHTLIGTAVSTAGNDAAQAWYYAIQSSRLTLQGGSLVVTGGASAIGKRTNTVFPILQKLTVTRAVNGVAKAQAAGTTVELFEPAYYAL